eukprot:768455-Hanusia_phi.AAC.14
MSQLSFDQTKDEARRRIETGEAAPPENEMDMLCHWLQSLLLTHAQALETLCNVRSFPSVARSL